MLKKLILYSLNVSSPVRSVKIVAKLIGLELEIRDVDLFAGEHLKESYIKLNPEQTVPTLDDNGKVIWESHAICTYLIDKYASNDALYPKDLFLRAKCNQRLFFDASSLYQRSSDCAKVVFHKSATEIPQDKIDPIYAAYDILETFLATDPFLVGNNLTVADICAAGSVTSMNIYAPFVVEKHSNITAWLARINQKLPFYENLNGKFVKEYRRVLYEEMEKNKQKQQII